jgi:hypothetical protein
MITAFGTLIRRSECRLFDRPPWIPDIVAEDATQARDLVPGDLDDPSVQVAVRELRSPQVVVVGVRVGVVVPMDEPDLGDPHDRLQLEVQRLARLDIAQQHDRLRPETFDRGDHEGETATRRTRALRAVAVPASHACRQFTGPMNPICNQHHRT